MAFKKTERFQDCQYCNGTGDFKYKVSIGEHTTELTIKDGCSKCDKGKVDWVNLSKDLIIEQKMKYQLWVIFDTGLSLLILAFFYFFTEIDLLYGVIVFLSIQLITCFFLYLFYTSDTFDAKSILKSIDTEEIVEDFSHLEDYDKEIDLKELEKRYDHLVDTPKKKQRFR